MNKREEYDIPFMNRTDQYDELMKERAKSGRLKVCIVVVTVLALIGGWIGGSFLPIPGTDDAKSTIQISQVLDPSDKIDTILEIMEKEWFFASDIEDIGTRLSDQAMYGITTNEEDPHTSYMSAAEMEAFTQSINRNFVGIGVQFIATNGINLVEKVFKNSPAEKAGVMAGDIIHVIDGTVADGLTADEIKELVQGDEGTEVTIDFLRQGQTVTLTITRGAISATTFGKILEDNIAYLQLYQFGEGSPDEIDAYLDEFQQNGCTKLIVDLRDNGGGYLDALQKIASRFLPEGTTVMQQEYSDGSVEITKTSGKNQMSFNGMVILVNENTASASEVFTMAMKEQRDDVTVIGTTTYGKGTVQISRMFKDNSAIKYTTSKWLSPSGVWVNNVGIEPDVEVKLHDVMYEVFDGLEEEIRVDSVSEAVKDVQLSLDYLEYDVDRTDGYFSTATEETIKQYQKEHDLPATGVLDNSTYEAIISSVTLDWNTTSVHDTQLEKAMEVLHG